MNRARLLFVDNFDSFTYNVVHLLVSQGASVEVRLNDELPEGDDALRGYDGLVVGPGPGTPAGAPQMLDAIARAVRGNLPVLGVCLGLQAIGHVFGAAVTHAPRLMHGKTSTISHDGRGLFAGVPNPFVATRYHSLCLDPASLPPELLATAHSEDGVVQGIRHARLPLCGVQFHPESILSEHGERLVRNFIDLAAGAVPGSRAGSRD